MHSSPAGPPPSARLRRIVGPVGTLVVVLRRTRLLPVTLTALALGAFAVAAPLAPYDDDARSTAALSTTARGEQGLVPATGDGWTQDGIPAAPSSSDVRDEPRSPSSSASPSAPSPSPASSAPSQLSSRGSKPSTAASEPADEAATGAPAPSSTASTASSSSAAQSAVATTESSSAAPSETPAVATPTADPATEILAAVDTARAAAGCDALAADAALAALAAEHSAALRDGTPPPDLGGRTAVTAIGTDPSAVAAGWLGDGTLLDCALATVGVATADTFWTLVAA